MKKIFLLVSVFWSSVQGFSQIILEHQYNIYKKDFYVSDIGNNDYKYIITDSIGFSLYNLDHSPYLLNIVSPITLWQPPTFYEISYITKSLFDCDTTNIEYAITQWKSPANYYVFRTDGTLLFEKDSVTGYFSLANADGSQYLHAIENTPDGTKLFLSDNRNNVLADSLYVYSLCGTLPISISEIPLNTNYMQVFPNPANEIINFEINQPNKGEKFKLTIYNSSLQKVDEAIINGRDYQLDLKQKFLAADTYLFDLRTEHKVLQIGKFIITK